MNTLILDSGFFGKAINSTKSENVEISDRFKCLGRVYGLKGTHDRGMGVTPKRRKATKGEAGQKSIDFES